MLCIHEEYTCVQFLWHPHKYSAPQCGQVLSLQLCQLFLVVTPSQENDVAPFLMSVCALILGYPLENRYCSMPVHQVLMCACVLITRCTLQATLLIPYETAEFGAKATSVICFRITLQRYPSPSADCRGNKNS